MTKPSSIVNPVTPADAEAFEGYVTSSYGYRAGRDMRLIVHHREHGEVERHRCDVGMIESEPA